MSSTPTRGIPSSEGGGVARLIPHRSSATEAIALTLDGRPARHTTEVEAGRVLIATSTISEEPGIPTTIVLDLLRCSTEIRLLVLDAPDEGLAGLRELPQLVGYTDCVHRLR